MRRLRSAALALVACLGLGCFVLDELDRSGTVAAEGSGASRGAADAPAEPAPAAASRRRSKEPPGLLARLSAWWEEARKPGPDPDDPMVRCEIQGRTHFMLRSACLQQLGRVAGEVRAAQRP